MRIGGYWLPVGASPKRGKSSKLIVNGFAVVFPQLAVAVAAVVVEVVFVKGGVGTTVLEEVGNGPTTGDVIKDESVNAWDVVCGIDVG